MADDNAPSATPAPTQSLFGDKVEAASKANAEAISRGELPAQPAQADPKPDAAQNPPAQTPDPKAQPQPADKAPADAKPAEGEANDPNKKPDESAKPKPPEKYELKLSDNSLLDKSFVDKVESYAKTNGLSQDDAANLLKAQEADVASFVETRKATWLEQTKSDREIGGEALTQNVQLADSVLQKFASPELRREFDRTGYGNHPEMLRFLMKVGRASQNDRAHVPSAHKAPEKSAADLLYDNPKSK